MTDSSAAGKAAPATPPAARRAVAASNPRSAQARAAAAQPGTRSTQPGRTPATGTGRTAAKTPGRIAATGRTAAGRSATTGTGRATATGRAAAASGTAASRATTAGRTSAAGRATTGRAATGGTGRTAATGRATGRTSAAGRAAATSGTAASRATTAGRRSARGRAATTGTGRAAATGGTATSRATTSGRTSTTARDSAATGRTTANRATTTGRTSAAGRTAATTGAAAGRATTTGRASRNSAATTGRASAAGRTSATGPTATTPGRTAATASRTSALGRAAAAGHAAAPAVGRATSTGRTSATARDSAAATGRTSAAGRTSATGRTATTPGRATTTASRAAAPGRAGRTAPARPRTRSHSRPAARRAAQRLRFGDPGRRLTVGFAAVCTLLVVLGVRLVQLQTLDGPRYAAAALHPKLDVTVITAERGRILDRDGHPLAYTVAARTVFADPKLSSADAQVTARTLSPLLGIPAATLVPKLTKKGRYSILARDVTPTNAARILALKLPGIGADDATQRIYPGGATAAGVIGFTGRDGTGLAGLELKYDDILSGTDGKITTEAGKDGTEIPSGERKEVAAVPGSAIRLTVDEDLQYMVQAALTQAVKDANAKDGQVVVLDARTGDVLAMASAPTYDAQKASSADPKTLGNPPVQSVFEPGSANKIVTFSAALDQGLIRPGDRMTVPGSIPISDRVVHDAWVHGPVKYTATGVLAKSSNVGTLMIAQKLGPAAFYDYETRFGIGARTDVGLPGESAGYLPPPNTWSGSTFGNLPIGQGVSMTALQLASMYQTVANGKTGTAQKSNPACTCYSGGGYWATFAGMAPATSPRFVVSIVIDEAKGGAHGGAVAAPLFNKIASYELSQDGVPPTGNSPQASLTWE
jgi:cell division protein FtsI (penicillin-binding protein 3)